MTTSITCVSAQGGRLTCDMGTALTPARRETAIEETAQWIKRLRLVRYDGVTMRERFTYRDDSLWWFTELYLHKMRRLERAVATVIALDALRAEHDPARLLIETSDAAVAQAAAAFGQGRNVPVEVSSRLTRRGNAGPSSYLDALTARVSRMRPHRDRAPLHPNG